MADEIRSTSFELRSAGDDGLTLEGLAAVFNSPTRIYERGQEFDEVIAPGAFSRTINSADRIIMQYDHGTNPVFGPLPIGRIDSLRESDQGLHVTARLNDSWLTEPIRAAIANGAVTGMSFRFSVPEGGDTWDRSGDIAKRTIKEVKLYELGPVTTPAYSDTAVAVRSLQQHLGALIDRQDGTPYIVRERGPEIMVPAPSRSEVTPDEGSPEADPVTPDEGSRFRTRSQRQALLTLHSIRKDSDV